MKILKLNVAYGPLNPGEEAGFPNEEANEMIAKGIGFLIGVEDGAEADLAEAEAKAKAEADAKAAEEAQAKAEAEVKAKAAKDKK